MCVRIEQHVQLYYMVDFTFYLCSCGAHLIVE